MKQESKVSFKEQLEGVLSYVGAVFGLLIILGILEYGHNYVWGEQEGEIKTEDCRTKVDVKEGSLDTYFKKFTCIYVKSNKGKIITGACESVVIDGGVCQTAYRYTKKSEIRCTDPKFPIPGLDDMCHSQ